MSDWPTGTFGAILADPPWNFQEWSDKGSERSARKHYDTMTFEAIQALPVAELAGEDCALFLWITWPTLPEALVTIEAWGFEYKTCGFCWVKTNPIAGSIATGMGYWTRSNTEVVFLATRGKPQRVSKAVRQVVVAPRREHSRKPDEVHDRIEALVQGPYLELFGRQERPGWTVWGNEIGKFTPEPRNTSMTL